MHLVSQMNYGSRAGWCVSPCTNTRLPQWVPTLQVDMDDSGIPWIGSAKQLLKRSCSHSSNGFDVDRVIRVGPALTMVALATTVDPLDSEVWSFIHFGVFGLT